MENSAQPQSKGLGLDPHLVREIQLQAQGEGPFLDTLEHSEGSGEDWLNHRTRAVFLDQGVAATSHYVDSITDGGIYLLSLLKPTDLSELNYARSASDSRKPCADMVYGVVSRDSDRELGWSVREFYSGQDITDSVVTAGSLPKEGNLLELPELVLCTNFIFSKTPTTGSDALRSLFDGPEADLSCQPSCVAIVPELADNAIGMTFRLAPIAKGAISTSGDDPVYFHKYIRPLSPLGLPAVISVEDTVALYEGRVSPALYESVGFFLSRAIKAQAQAKSDLTGGYMVDLKEVVLNSVGFTSEPPVRAFSLVAS